MWPNSYSISEFFQLTMGTSFSQVYLCSTLRGVSYLHPIILPLIPCPFQRYANHWRKVPSWGYHMRYTTSDTPGQDRTGYTTARTYLGYPQSLARAGVPSRRLHWDRLCCRQYTSCSFPQGNSPVTYKFTDKELK